MVGGFPAGKDGRPVILGEGDERMAGKKRRRLVGALLAEAFFDLIFLFALGCLSVNPLPLSPTKVLNLVYRRLPAVQPRCPRRTDIFSLYVLGLILKYSTCPNAAFA